MTSETTIVEVNGVKMEIDLRQAKVVHQNIKVGTKVKVLEKGGYSGPVVYPGIVAGFEPFKDLPTIIVAYFKSDYSSASVSFAYINSKSAEKWDLVPAVDDELPIAKGDALRHFDKEIEKKHAEIRDLEEKRAYFLRTFGQFFEAPVVEDSKAF